MRLHVKLLQIGHGQVNAPAHRVFAHVADDIGQLQRLPELVGVGGGLSLGLTKYLRCYFSDDACNQMAVALQRREVEVAGLRQVHLAAFNHGIEMTRFNFEIGR